MLSQDDDKKSQEVLEIYQNVVQNESSESFEGGTTDTQKAIIEEMCHVVWRVLDKKNTSKT